MPNEFRCVISDFRRRRDASLCAPLLFTALCRNEYIGGGIFCQSRGRDFGRAIGHQNKKLLVKKWRILLGSVTSSEYTVGHGLREGPVLSPVLYAVFVDGIVDRLVDATRVGTRVVSEIIRCLLYADDICLMVDSAADLQRILGVCQKYADVSSFQFSMEKSQVIIFSDYEHDRYKNEFRLMGVLMKSGPRIQVLGLILHERKPRPQFGAWLRPCMRA